MREKPEHIDKPCLCKLIKRSGVIWVPTGKKNASSQAEFR
jgi:ribosomal protein L36